jgi:hypothetical protein
MYRKYTQGDEQGMGLQPKKLQKKKKQNQGAAMIVAIVVSVVLMAFALSLLLLSYSLVSSVSGNVVETQCKELAKSVSEEIGQELMDVNYDSYDDQYAAAGNENNLWFFLRYNLWQDGTWPYYSDMEAGHYAADSYRYFRLNEADYGDSSLNVDRILLTMYWEIDSDQPAEETDKSFTVLHIRVEVERGDYAYALDSAYALTVTSYVDESDDGDMATVENADINPQGNEIVRDEKWIWTPD